VFDLFRRWGARPASRKGRADLLVVGCGNVAAGDDAAGVQIVARLKEAGHSRCRFVAVPDAGPDLLDLFSSVETALFVDAVTSSASAGTLHLVPLPSREIEPRAIGTLSSHGWGLAQTLELGRALNRPLPRLMLLGIELGTVEVGAAPSGEVTKAIARVVKKFPILHSRLVNPENPIWREPKHYPPEDTSFPKG